jgi:hypothetical protein
MKKILNMIISFFDKIDDDLREMYGIDNRNLGKKR